MLCHVQLQRRFTLLPHQSLPSEEGEPKGNFSGFLSGNYMTFFKEVDLQGCPQSGLLHFLHMNYAIVKTSFGPKVFKIIIPRLFFKALFVSFGGGVGPCGSSVSSVVGTSSESNLSGSSLRRKKGL